MQKTGIGKKHWVIPGGHIPLKSNGREPEFSGSDKLSILNTHAGTAEITLTIHFEDQAAYGPYNVRVEGERVRKVRFNDLIDPLALPYGVPYACVLVSDIPVVVQFTRQDTSQAANAGCLSIAFPVPHE